MVRKKIKKNKLVVASDDEIQEEDDEIQESMKNAEASMSKSFKKVTQRNRRKIVRKKEERRYEAYSMDLVSNVNDPGVQLLYHGGVDHEKKQKQL